MPGAKSPQKKLRILQVMASGPGTGGIEKHFFELCNRLAQHHSVVAVCHPAYRHGLSADVDFESLGRFIGRRNPATVMRLIQVVRKWRPDVIHAHASRAAALVLQASPFTSAARVATVHGLKRRHLVFRGFDRVIAVSRGVASQLGGIPAEVIYNGITPPSPAVWQGQERSGWPCLSHNGLSHNGDPRSGAFPLVTPRHPEEHAHEAARFAWSDDSSLPVAVSVGRLDAVKGFDVLVEAWRGVEGRLLIVGEGPQRDRLESQIRESGLADRVQLLGYRTDVPRILSAADLVVIASRREGFGYTLAEALLLRRLVVSTDVPAANEILPPAFLVPREDPAALREPIARTLADREPAREAFGPVWEQAAALFTIDAMVASTSRVYAELASLKAFRRPA